MPIIQSGWSGRPELTGVHMNELAIRMREDRGMSTAEYAVGTVAVCALGGILIKILSGATMMNLIIKVISKAFDFLF